MHRDYGGQTIRITLTTHTHTGGRENLQSRQETLQVNKIWKSVCYCVRNPNFC